MKKEGREIEREGKERREKTAGYSIPSARRGAERSGVGREMMLGATLALSRNRSTCLPGGRQARIDPPIARRGGALSALHNVAAANDNGNVESFFRKL